MVSNSILLFFSIFFIVSGVLVTRHKKFGPEEGSRGRTVFKGKTASLFGLVEILMGIALLIVWIIFLMRS